MSLTSQVVGAVPVSAAEKQWHCLRWFIVALLSAAAAAKAVARPDGNVTPSNWSLDLMLRICLVEFETFLAIWLASGFQPRRVWSFAVGAFWVFLIASAYDAFVGKVSCGCFGSIQIPPVYIAALDGVIVLALCRWPPLNSSNLSIRSWPSKRLLTVYSLIAVAVAAFTSVSASGEHSRSGAPAAIPQRIASVDGKPETWVGRRCPLLGHIGVRDKLAKGNWVLVLYRDGCGSCEKVIAACQARGGICVINGTAASVALIRVPGRDDQDELPEGAAKIVAALPASLGELPNIHTPCALVLRAGDTAQFYRSSGLNRIFPNNLAASR